MPVIDDAKMILPICEKCSGSGHGYDASGVIERCTGCGGIGLDNPSEEEMRYKLYSLLGEAYLLRTAVDREIARSWPPVNAWPLLAAVAKDQRLATKYMRVAAAGIVAAMELTAEDREAAQARVQARKSKRKANEAKNP